MALSRFADSISGSQVNTLYGPLTAIGTSNGGVPQPMFTPGQQATGDRAGEWTYCTLVLGSTTTLANGQAYQFDKDFSATILTTAAATRGLSVGIGCVSQANVVAGTYYLWLQTYGHGPSQATGVLNALAETTATGGLVNYTNTPTTNSKAIKGLYLYATNQTFTANTVINTNTLTAVSSLNDVSVGATVAGTGIPGATTVTAVGIVNGVNTVTMSANATATGTAVTVTQTGVLTANIIRPYVDQTN